MSAVRHIFLLALAFILQTTWVDSIKIGSIKPDLLIVALSLVALRRGPVVGAYMGLGLGIFQDLYTPADLGVNALAKSLIGAGFGYSHTHIVSDSIQMQTALIFCAVIVHDLIYYTFTGADVAFFEVEIFKILGRAAFTGLISAVFLVGLLIKRYLFPA